MKNSHAGYIKCLPHQDSVLGGQHCAERKMLWSFPQYNCPNPWRAGVANVLNTTDSWLRVLIPVWIALLHVTQHQLILSAPTRPRCPGSVCGGRFAHILVLCKKYPLFPVIEHAATLLSLLLTAAMSSCLLLSHRPYWQTGQCKHKWAQSLWQQAAQWQVPGYCLESAFPSRHVTILIWGKSSPTPSSRCPFSQNTLSTQISQNHKPLRV